MPVEVSSSFLVGYLVFTIAFQIKEKLKSHLYCIYVIFVYICVILDSSMAGLCNYGIQSDSLRSIKN